MAIPHFLAPRLGRGGVEQHTFDALRQRLIFDFRLNDFILGDGRKAPVSVFRCVSIFFL